MSDLLTPILVSGFGRSGTTALMALLGTDARIAFDRRYPFENRYLTYLTKFALLTGRPGAPSHFDAGQLNAFDDEHFGPVPWPTFAIEGTAPSLQPSMADWLAGLWRTFSEGVRRRFPEATHYAEKVPAWLPAVLRDVVPSRTMHLVRDPRDMFLSARAFAKSRNAIGFGMEPGRSAMDSARHTAHGLLSFAENERSDRGRPDVSCVRYEDWIERPADVASHLSDFLNVSLSPAAVDVTKYLNFHKTSADAAATVGRWRREPLPAPVRSCLESHLFHFMTAYGYGPSTDARPALELALDPMMPCSADGSLRREGDVAAVVVTRPDFWVELPPERFQADSIAEVWLCLRGQTGDHHSLYWRGPREPFAEQRSLHVPFRPGRHWQIVRFRSGEHRLWKGTIEQLRIDLFNGTLTPGGSGEVRWVRPVS